MPAIHHAILGLTRNPLPIITTLPVISGVPRVNEVLSASTGSWFGKPTSFTYVWYRGIQSIATGNTYTPTTSDISARLTVRVTATNEFGSTTVESLPTDIVASVTAASGDVLLLENGDRLLLEDGSFVLLETPPVLPSNVLLLENGDRLLLEDGSFILLEEQPSVTGESLLLETGYDLLTESGFRILLDLLEAPTDAILDVSGSYMLDVSGNYIRQVP